jgi:hypothetical protein
MSETDGLSKDLITVLHRVFHCLRIEMKLKREEDFYYLLKSEYVFHKNNIYWLLKNKHVLLLFNNKKTIIQLVSMFLQFV